MKLLFCCENYAPSVGGVQEVVRQVAQWLVRAGSQVTVATGAHPNRPNDVMMDGVRVVSFSIKGNWTRGIVGSVGGYQRFVIDGGFDVVCIKAAQQWSFDALVDILPLIQSRKVFIPCGFSGLYQPAYQPYYVRMAAWLTHFQALIFYANEYRDIQFAKAAGISALHVIPNGADAREFDGIADTTFRAKHAIGSEDLLLLTVGSLTGSKGHWEVLKAFELAQLPAKATLVLNGNDPGRSLKGRLKQYINDIWHKQIPIGKLVERIHKTQGLKKSVLLCDLPRAELVSAFKASDLFVFASHVEYSPLVLFEAAAAGIPFLASQAGNSQEIANWFGSGVIFPSKADKNGFLKPDPAIIARNIEALFSDRLAMRAMGVRGRESFVRGEFCWERISARYAAIFEND